MFLALWKYYRYSKTLGEAAVPFLEAREAGKIISRDDALRAGAFLTYWCTSLHTVSEGWRELGLQDSAVDVLINDHHMDTLGTASTHACTSRRPPAAEPSIQ
jgi:hypothetical protein